MRIAGVESTDLFVGTAQRPLQVIRVTLENDGPASALDGTATVYVQGPGTRDQGPGARAGEWRRGHSPVFHPRSTQAGMPVNQS